jgi:hypothetical protein
MPVRRPLLASLFVALLAACGGSVDEPPPYGAPPLVDLRVPAAAPADWTFGGAGGTVRRIGQEDVVFMARGAEPATLSIPFQTGLSGARRVRVHYMADGPFSMSASIAGHESPFRDGVDSKRQQHLLELELPKTVEADAGALTLTCRTQDVPVVVFRVQVAR